MYVVCVCITTQIEINRKLAIEKALEIAKNYLNSVILVLGKGDEEEQIIYDQKFPLNDKSIIKELLK